jgi:hypothetical protein
MVRSLNARAVANLGIAAALTLFLGACGGGMSLPSFSSSPAVAPEPGVAPEMPATIRADEIVGRWGLASYQNPNDRARTEAAARSQCKQPYVIWPVPRRRDHASGRPGDAAGTAPQRAARAARITSARRADPGERDREIVSFDGRVLVTVHGQGRRGSLATMVYVRCAACACIAATPAAS